MQERRNKANLEAGKKHKEFMTIGELAKATDVHIETIRFYQRRGLMDEPERPTGGIRRYGEVDSDRIRFIKSSQRLGFSLDEIIMLLALDDGADCKTALRIAKKKLTEVKSKIIDLRQIEKSLSGMIGLCETNDAQQISCPLISALHARRNSDKS